MPIPKCALPPALRQYKIYRRNVHSALTLFYKPVTALIGPSAKIIVPKVAQPVEKHIPDYEVELTIVIGKSAKNVSEADALEYVLAYTCGNDVSHVPGTVER